MSIIVWIVAGAVVGWLAARTRRGEDPLGVTGHIVVGIVAAVSGGFLAGAVFDVDILEGPVELLSTVSAVVAATLVAAFADAVVQRSGRGRDAAGHAR